MLALAGWLGLARAAAPLAVNDLVDVASITVPADPAERVVELIANAQLVDRMGDLIVSNPDDCEKYGGQGWELTNFMAAGGPYLWSHDPRLPAVGKVVGHEVRRVPVQVEGEARPLAATELAVLQPGLQFAPGSTLECQTVSVAGPACLVPVRRHGRIVYSGCVSSKGSFKSRRSRRMAPPLSSSCLRSSSVSRSLACTNGFTVKLGAIITIV